MPELADLLRDAAPATVDPLDVDRLRRRVHRRGRRRRAVVVVAALGALGVAAVAVHQLTSVGRSPRVVAGPATTAATAAGGVFTEPTGVVLLVGDGYDGMLSLDLDHRVATRRVVDGARAGDQPWLMTRTGDSLIVGWGQVWAAPLAGGASRLLGRATIFVPAAEAGRVWLVDYPGGSLGSGTPTLREVDASGHTVLAGPGPAPSLGFAGIGVPGGVALEGPHGVALWSVAQGRVVRTLGTQQAQVAGSSGHLLAWCEGGCTSLHVTDLDGTDTVVAARPGWTFVNSRWSAPFSPDGRQLAVTETGTSTTGAPVSEVLVVDTRTGRTRTVSGPVTVYTKLAWSPDGTRLFFLSGTRDTTTVGQLSLRSGRTQTAVLALGGANPFVVVDRSEAGAFLTGHLGDPATCAAPAVYPSNRTGICAFHF
jgi:hypothetical protein